MKFLYYLLGFIIFLHFAPHLYSKKNTDIFNDYCINKYIQILIVVTVYSTIKTNAETVMLILLVPIILTITLLIKKEGYSVKLTPAKESTPPLIALILFSIVIFSIQYFLLTSSASGNINLSNRDYIFYTNISEFLLQNGIESAEFNEILKENIIPTPYHYFQPWLHAFFGELTNLPIYQISYLITFTMIRALIILTFYSIISSIWPKYLSLIFAFSAISATGIYIPIIYEQNQFLSTSINLAWNHLTTPKLLPIYFSFAFFLLCAFRFKNKSTAISALSVTPVLYAPAAFWYLGFSTSFVTFQHLKNKSFKKTIFLFSAALLPIALVSMFYSQYSTAPAGSIIGSGEDVIRGIKIFTGSIFLLFMIFFPYLIIMTVSARKGEKYFGQISLKNELIAPAVGGLVFSVSGWIVFMHNTNGAQALSIYIPIFAIIIFFVIVSSQQRPVSFLATALVIVNILQFRDFPSDFQRFDYRYKDTASNISEFKHYIGDLTRAGVIHNKVEQSGKFYNFNTHRPFIEISVYENGHVFHDLTHFTATGNSLINNKATILELIRLADIQYIIACPACSLPSNIAESFRKNGVVDNWIIYTKNDQTTD